MKTEYQYDGQFPQRQSVDILGTTANMTYDSRSFIADVGTNEPRISGALGNSCTYQYDQGSSQTGHIDPRGRGFGGQDGGREE